MKPAAGTCLDDATLAAFLDDNLDSQTRASAESHLADCPKCCGLLMDAAKTEWEMDGRVVVDPAPAPARTRWLVAVGGLAAAATLLLVLRVQPEWVSGLWSSPAERRMAALVGAVGEQRLVEGRLASAFKYGPLRSARRGAAPSENAALLEAAAALQNAADANPNRENLHAWGVAQLLLAQYDQAVVTLERANAQQTDLAVMIDLSAAYLARASFTGQPDDPLKALAMAERATQIGPRSEEARFNRALALERLGRGAEAQQAWTELLEMNPRSPWATEIKSRLRAPSQ